MTTNIEDIVKAAELNLQTYGFLVPIALLCCPDGVKSLSLGECKQGEEFKYVCGFIVQEQAHKLIIITESWAWVAPAEMPLEQLQEIINHETFTHQLEQEAVYQIIEVTKDNIRIYSRPVYKEETDDGKVLVTFGEKLLTEAILIESYKSIQEVLAVIN